MSFNVNTFNSDNWHRDAKSISERDRVKTRRWGMRVTVYQGASAGDYVLTYGLASINLQDNANWLKVADIGATWGGGGSGGLANADNGLNVNVPGNVQWGGPLIVDTYIEMLDGNSYFNLNPGSAIGSDAYLDIYFEDALSFSEVFAMEDIVFLMQDSASIQLDPTGIEIAAAPGSVAITSTTGMNIENNGSGILFVTALGGDLELASDGLTTLSGDALLIAATAGNITMSASFGGSVSISASNDVTINATDDINLNPTSEFRLKGVAAATPTTMFFRGDGTWAVPGGGGGATNIYNADGNLAANRTLTGDAFTLTFFDLAAFTVNAFQQTYTDVMGSVWTSDTGFTFNSGGFLIQTPGGSFFAFDNGGGVMNSPAGSTILVTDTDVNMISTLNVRIQSGPTGDVTLQASDDIILNATDDINLNPTSEFRLKGVAAASPTTMFFRGDGTWAVPGALTANNGLTITTGNIQLGGPLVQNTLINGASFNLQFGTFLTSPIGNFQSYASTHFWSSRDPGTGDGAGITLNTQCGIGFTGQAGRLTVQQNTPQTSDATPLSLFNRSSANSNTPGLSMGWSGTTNGTAAAGFGIYHQTDLEVSNGTSWIAMQEETTWEVATVAAEFAQWRRLLARNHSVLEVYKIETNPDILHTFTGLVSMANLPTSDPGIPGRLWVSAGQLMVSP